MRKYISEDTLSHWDRTEKADEKPSSDSDSDSDSGREEEEREEEEREEEERENDPSRKEGTFLTSKRISVDIPSIALSLSHAQDEGIVFLERERGGRAGPMRTVCVNRQQSEIVPSEGKAAEQHVS